MMTFSKIVRLSGKTKWRGMMVAAALMGAVGGTGTPMAAHAAPAAQAAPSPSSSSGAPAADASPTPASPKPTSTLRTTTIKPKVTIRGVTEYQLDNGLRILLAPDSSQSQTTVNMSYKVGSRNEGPGETGMAHLLEHMLFRGGPEHPDALAEFSRRGLDANGSTAEDLTNYYASFSSDPETLRWYLSWQAQAMRHAQINRANLDAEMTVVRNEMERDQNSPFSVLLKQTVAAAYVWHPYGRSVAGAKSDVEHVDVGQLRMFYDRYYQPDNAVLIITGRFDPQQTLQWIATEFGAIPRPARQLPKEYTVEPVQQGARAVTLRRRGGSPIIMALYHMPAAASDDFTALSIGSAMLSDTPAGPLYQALVRHGPATGVFGHARGLYQPGYAVFGAQLAPDADAQASLANLEQTLESGDTIMALEQSDLDRVRTAWMNGWEQIYNRPANLAAALSDAVSDGDWRLFFIDRQRVEALSLQDIQDQLKAWLVPSNRTSGTYLPTTDPGDAPAAPRPDLTPWIAKLPLGTARETIAAFDSSPAAIDDATQRKTLMLASGPVDVALLPKATPGQEVHAVFQMGFGNVDQFQGLNLIPALTASMLKRGTKDLSRQEIEDRLNTLDSNIVFDSEGNLLNAYIRSTRDNLPAVMDLLMELLRNPSFPPDELIRMQRRIAAHVQDQVTNPAFLVRNTLARQDQPWSRDDIRYTATPRETLERAQAITRDDLQRFHDHFYGAGHLKMSAVGDFDPAALEAQLREALSDWHTAPSYVRISDPWYPVTPKIFHIPTPGKANANYLATLALQLQDNDPRWPALLLGNYLLGGMQDSRLWQRVRVRDGLSYSVGSGISASPWEPSGAWTLYATMAPDNADTVEQAIRDTVEHTLEKGFTQDEIDQGVTSLLHYFKLGRSDDSSLASAWMSYLNTGRSFARQTYIEQQLKALTADDVNSAMRAMLKPRGLSIAIAADPASKDAPEGGTAAPAPVK